MTSDRCAALDHARTAIAICAAVDSGDVQSFEALVRDFDPNDWIALAEQTLILLRETLHVLARSVGSSIGSLYEQRQQVLLQEERTAAAPRNLVRMCLERHFGRDCGHYPS